MADLIDSRQLIADLTAMKQFYDAISLDGIIDALRKAPTIDAVPVVRCRECRYYHGGTGWCECHSFFVTSEGEPCAPACSDNWRMFQENDFCSYGEAKMDGEWNDE